MSNSSNSSPAAQGPEESRSPSYYRPWMGFLTLIIIAALLAGFWSYSEHLIGTLERQASRLQVQEQALAILAVEDHETIPLSASPSFSHIRAHLFFDRNTSTAALRITDTAPFVRQDLRLWILHDTTVVGNPLLRTSGDDPLWGVVSIPRIESDAERNLVLTMEQRGGLPHWSQGVIARGTMSGR